MAASDRSLLVLGLGNLLCADDGLGIHAVESILDRYEIPQAARVLDGGTLGLSLLSYFDGADDVILIDAIADDEPAGTLVRLDGDQVAPAVRNRLSCHQIGVADLLDALQLLGSLPKTMVLLGMVPESLELATCLTPPVAANLPSLVRSVAAEASRLGFEFALKENIGTDGVAVAHNRLPTAAARGM